MLDLQKQEEIMRKKLAYYDEVISERPEGYGRFKRAIAIPRINRAIRKISDGTYGDCDDCGNRIPEERLKLIPAALLCVSCQRILESKQ
jgi:phage/conjugal plasmid C-4 type zinc finger TraR family protein